MQIGAVLRAPPPLSTSERTVPWPAPAPSQREYLAGRLVFLQTYKQFYLYAFQRDRYRIRPISLYLNFQGKLSEAQFMPIAARSP